MSQLDFHNTEIAFAYKSTSELRKANFIFSLIQYPQLTKFFTKLVRAALSWHLPIETIIKKTVYDHFCGGETIADCHAKIHQLYSFRVHTILDYSAEGEQSEKGFDESVHEILRTITRAKNEPAIPFCVFKPTAIAPFALLEKWHANEPLSDEEKARIEKAKKRLHTICQAAFENQVPVLIDAEETWIQNPIDEWAYAMMKLYNQEKVYIYNTYQMYVHEKLNHLKTAHDKARAEGYKLGVKMVRGAYMEKERARAEEHHYPSPICADKSACDNSFDSGVTYCMQHLDTLSFLCCTHNEPSNRLAISLMEKNNITKNDARVWFVQLYGMSDTLSFNLSAAGYNVAKYVPYGPVHDVMPYLFRRAEENTSVAGQTGRELQVIRQELKRRQN